MHVSRGLSLFLLLAGCGLASGCAASNRIVGEDTAPVTGTASYIAPTLAGRRTASGVPFDPASLVAAHRTLPFGTRLRVTNLENDREVVVTVIDRGPFRRGRILDLSPSAARELGFLRQGTTRVRIERIGADEHAEARER